MTSETHELEDTHKKPEPHDSHLYTSFSKKLQELFVQGPNSNIGNSPLTTLVQHWAFNFCNALPTYLDNTLVQHWAHIEWI